MTIDQLKSVAAYHQLRAEQFLCLSERPEPQEADVAAQQSLLHAAWARQLKALAASFERAFAATADCETCERTGNASPLNFP
jgi:hypothetical protein